MIGEKGLKRLKKQIETFIIMTIVLFIIGASYERGLFFHKDLYWIEIGIGTIFYLFILIKLREIRHVSKYPYVLLFVSILFIYFIHVFIAENRLLAFQEFFKWVMAFQLFLIVLILKERKWLIEVILISFIIMGVWTSIFGWLTAFKLIHFQDAFLDERIRSVFQYPNTYGAILASILIGLLIRGADPKRRYSCLSCFSFLITITLIFTYSRGAWLVLVLVWLVVLFILSLRQQILYLVHSLLIGIAIMITLEPIHTAITDSQMIGLFIIGITSILLGLLNVFIVLFVNNRFHIEKRNNKFVRRLVPFSVLLLLLSSYFFLINTQLIEKLPNTFRLRINGMNFEITSVLERLQFNHDATKMIRDHLFFGSGGGAWTQQFERYQTFPYTSDIIHNFYYQLGVEIGIIGLFLYLLGLALILYSLVKYKNRLDEIELNKVTSIFFMLMVMLIHSYIDFNMVYGYFFIIFMIFLAIIAYPIEWKFSKGFLSYINLFLILIFSFVAIINSTKFLYAEKLVQNTNEITSENIDKISNSIRLNPYEITYRFQKINIYDQAYERTREKKYKKSVLLEAMEIKKMKQYNPTTMFYLAQVLAKNGYVEDAIELLDIGIKNGPWRLDLYDQRIIYSFYLAQHFKEEDNEEKYKENINDIFSLYNEVLNRRHFLDNQMIALQYRPYHPTDTMLLFVGKAYAVQGEYEKALNLLLNLVNHQESQIRNEAIIWAYLSSEKLNSSDKLKEVIGSFNEMIVEKNIRKIERNWKLNNGINTR